jgi:putative salt-induced outer membrane protein
MTSRHKLRIHMRTQTIVAMGVMVLMPLWAHAQAAPAAAPPPRQEATAEFAFVGTSGNSSTESVGLGGAFIYRPDPWTLTTKAAYVRNEAASELKAQSLALAFNAARALRPRLSAFGRYGYLRDRFAGIEQRHTIEGGVAYLLVDAAPHKLTVDGALGYAHEGRVLGPTRSNGILTTGAVYTLKISETSDFSNDGRIVFSLSDKNDWRVANIASVAAKLTTRLSLKFSNTVRFVDVPVLGFEKMDTITAVALVAKF